MISHVPRYLGLCRFTIHPHLRSVPRDALPNTLDIEPATQLRLKHTSTRTHQPARPPPIYPTLIPRSLARGSHRTRATQRARPPAPAAAHRARHETRGGISVDAGWGMSAQPRAQAWPRIIENREGREIAIESLFPPSLRLTAFGGPGLHQWLCWARLRRESAGSSDGGAMEDQERREERLDGSPVVNGEGSVR